MTEERKRLYRELLYWAMIDMRTHSASAVGTLQSLLGQHRRSHCEINRFTYAMNHWLHQTALHAAADFEGFKEELFWQDYRWFRNNYPASRWAPFTETVIQKLQSSTGTS